MAELSNQVRVGDICDFVKGKKPGEISDVWREGDIPYILIESFTGSPSKFTKSVNLPRCFREDVLMVMDGASSGLVATGIEGAIGSTLAAIRPKKNALFPKYLYYWLKSKYDLLNQRTKGAAIPHVDKKLLQDLFMPIPELETQKRIASILDIAEKVLQQREAANQITVTTMNCVFLKMFGDPLSNPKGWETATLESVCIDVIDCPHSIPKYLESGVPLVRTPNIRKGYVDFSHSRFISPEEHKRRSRRIRPQKSDILYAREATFGNAALVDMDQEFSVGQRIMLLRPNAKLVKSEFLVWMINSYYVYSQASQVARGATNPHVNVADVKQFTILRPPMELQTRFATIVGRLNALREKQKRSTEEVNRLFQSIVHKAFRGELVLGDAEALNN